MTTQITKLALAHAAEAQIYLSADGAFVLTILPDGTALRLPRDHYHHLARGTPKPWTTRIFQSLYWVLRFLLLAAEWQRHR